MRPGHWDDGTTPRAIRERRPIWSADLLADPGFALAPETRAAVVAEGYRAVLSAPLLRGERALGALVVYRDTPGPFSSEEADLLQALAAQAAVAINNARLFEDTERRRREAEVLGDLVRGLNASLDLDTVLQRVTEGARELCGSDRAAIALQEPGSDTMVSRFWTGAGGGGPRALSLERVRADAGDVASLVVPIEIAGTAEGLLHVENGSSRPFTARDEAILTRLANHAAIAIHNARLLAALRESEERFRSAFEHSAVGMALQSTDGRYLRVNRAFCRMLGYSEAELLGLGHPAVTHPDDVATDAAYDRQLLGGELASYQTEKRYYGKRGDVVWGLVTVSVVSDAGGRPGYFVVQAQDVTERKRAEQTRVELEGQLQQAQKLEAIGRLAGGIAHDFNNLLTVIIGRTQLLGQRVRLEDEVRRHVELVEKTAERAAGLTRQLLAFGRKQVLRPKLLDVSATVAGMEAMLRRLIGEHIELITVRRARRAVLADPVQVEQVILNLAVNARDVMPDGGVLTIETAAVELDEAFVRCHAGARPGPHVLLAVSDTGRGMDAPVRARLFEPFFTTKELGQGTGLGLATVYGIVKQSEGYIYVESEPGRGTRFELYFPSEGPSEGPSAGSGPDLADQPSAVGARSRGEETVLLVEDEADVLAVTRDMLLACGYTVLEARNGAEALDLVSRHPGRISLLLTDVVMPGMSGRQLADRLTPRLPGVKVLFMSGYTDDAIVHHGVLERGIAFLHKPFSPDALAQRVRETLDAG
jgi:PAS domain S-box-containing protein